MQEADDLFQRMNNPKFRLYLAFLVDVLPLLDDINLQLQKSGQNMYYKYQKLECFINSSINQSINPKGSVDQENMIINPDVRFPGELLNQLITEYEHSDLTEDELDYIRENCIAYMIAVVVE